MIHTTITPTKVHYRVSLGSIYDVMESRDYVFKTLSTDEKEVREQYNDYIDSHWDIPFRVKKLKTIIGKIKRHE